MPRKEVAVSLPAKIVGDKQIVVQRTLRDEVAAKLKRGPEQLGTVGPLVEMLLDRGFELGQIQFGRSEWRVPKKAERGHEAGEGQFFRGFPL
jgi:type I restriction enzyme M protein